MALLGLIGGPLAFAGATGVLLGAFDPDSAAKFLLTLPEIVWEASLGIYLIAKGFKSAPRSSSPAAPVGADERTLVPAASTR